MSGAILFLKIQVMIYIFIDTSDENNIYVLYKFYKN